MRWNFLNGYSGILPCVEGAVYIYFGDVMDNGATLLTQGSLMIFESSDLCRKTGCA